MIHNRGLVQCLTHSFVRATHGFGAVKAFGQGRGHVKSSTGQNNENDFQYPVLSFISMFTHEEAMISNS